METFDQAVVRLDALLLTARAEQENWAQPCAMSRTLYEMVGNPPRRDDPDARLGELLRMIHWEFEGNISTTRPFVACLPVKGRGSKHLDLTLHAVGGGVIITLKGEGERASAYAHDHA
jgi:hypothetical protein